MSSLLHRVKLRAAGLALLARRDLDLRVADRDGGDLRLALARTVAHHRRGCARCAREVLALRQRVRLAVEQLVPVVSESLALRSRRRLLARGGLLRLGLRLRLTL